MRDSRIILFVHATPAQRIISDIDCQREYTAWVIITANCNNVAKERLADFGDSASAWGPKKKSGQKNIGKNDGGRIIMDQGDASLIYFTLSVWTSWWVNADARSRAFIHWRTYALCAPVFRGREAHSHACRAVRRNANRTEEEQRWRKAHANALRSHVMRAYRSRIEAGATLARIKALRTACP